ncbi:MAG: dihydropteroate synthase [Verrucomicrobiae bacterium]|nr:dihydropteroate synthase [Verrucomicrobiae bacterium]
MRFVFKDGEFDLSAGRRVIFGILNVTPDSFSDGGRHSGLAAAVEHALSMERDGADVIDVGGESTRPGAAMVSEEEEIRRVAPVIEELKRRLRIPISVDTSKTAVAEEAFRAGAVILNDISGLKGDPAMAGLAAEAGVGVILMHRRGVSADMQKLCHYDDVVEDVCRELGESLKLAEAGGLSQERLAVDPGIGFAKNREQNLVLLRRIGEFGRFQLPVMIGVSRKSFLDGEVQERAAGTLAVELWCHEKGVQLVRTHEPGPLRRALAAWDLVCRWQP